MFRFQIQSNVSRGPLSKGPVLIILIFCVLLWLSTVTFSFVNMMYDHYFPYEGKVLEIRSRWTDHVTFENTLWDHLIIKTPDGRIVDKLVGREQRLLARIKTGDIVAKRRGFSNPAQPVNKPTTSGILGM